jgi:small-conductance mechanosensitive channel
MRSIWKCRRTWIATLGVIVLGALGWHGADVASAIAAVTIGIAVSNAAQGSVAHLVSPTEAAKDA